MPRDRLSNDKDFLMWVRNRLVNLFGDPPEADFINRLENMSIFLPGPTVIPLRTADHDPEYFRIPKWRCQDVGDYYLIEKVGAEPIRQYLPYRDDPELVEQRESKRKEINIERNTKGTF